MLHDRFARPAAISLALFVALSLGAYALLSAVFDFPDVLRRTAPEMLAAFTAREELVRVGYALFALAHVLLAAGILLLARTLRAADGPALVVATFGGVLYALTQTFGFLRWPFLVPFLAARHAAATSDAERRDVLLLLEAMHRFAGMAIGEHASFVGLAIFLVGCGMTLCSARLEQRALGGTAIALGSIVALHALEPFGGAFTALGPLLLPAHAGFYAWLLAASLCLARPRSPQRVLAVLFMLALLPAWAD